MSAAAAATVVTPPAFAGRLLPAPRGGGFAQEGYWVWCGSAVHGEDGRFHLFASRWPRALPFTPNWLTNSEVVRAVADRPEGPYAFEEVVLPPRGAGHWDGRMTHNPTVHRAPDGTYLLFYTGTTFPDPPPTPGNPGEGGYAGSLFARARAAQRIGLATSRSVFGPWERPDAPLLEPRPGRWDALMTTNPAPCVRPDGSVLLAYKSTGHPTDRLRYGVAAAPRPEGPYERLADDPVFRFEGDRDHIEDAFVWREGGAYRLLMKDMAGGITGEQGAGVHAHSPDGVSWRIAEPARAYSRTVRWDDGTETTFPNLERPQLLIEDGRPTHLFLAAGEGERAWQFTRSRNIVIPLAGGEEDNL